MKAIIYNENCLIASLSLIKEILGVILILGEIKSLENSLLVIAMVTVNGRINLEILRKLHRATEHIDGDFFCCLLFLFFTQNLLASEDP